MIRHTEAHGVHDPTHPLRRTRIAVLSCSVRDERMSPALAEWVRFVLSAQPGIEIDALDLAEISLPDDALLTPGGGPTTEVSERLGAAEGFVFVTPEYNHSYPAALKRVLDWHYAQWHLKAASIVAYGVNGGFAAIEHLRGVLAELGLVTTRRCLGYPAPWAALDENERFAPSPGKTRALERTLAELSWWATLLSDARANRPFPR